MKEIIPGLPEPIRPHFWGELIPHISLLPPEYDDEVGFVWDPWIYTGPYYEDLPSLTFDQIIAGISGEIYVILNSSISREEQESYLKAIENHEVYQDIHSTRKRFEKEVNLKYDFASEDPEIPNLREHVRLMVTIEGLIEKAYVSIHTRAPFMSDNDDTSETIKRVNVSEVGDPVSTLIESTHKRPGKGQPKKLTCFEVGLLAVYENIDITKTGLREISSNYGFAVGAIYKYSLHYLTPKNRRGGGNVTERNNLKRIKRILPLIQLEKGRELALEDITELEKKVYSN